MTNLSANQLRERLLDSFRGAGSQVVLEDASKPYKLDVTSEDGRTLRLAIYVWNCTHGGGAARASDEYRVQFTGPMPTQHASRRTLVLGWHSGYEVWAAWDIRLHDGSTGRSPSAQIKEEALRNAHLNGFASIKRQNEEWALAFRSELIFEYADSVPAIHDAANTIAVRKLDKISTLTDEDITSIKNVERRLIVQKIVKRYRAFDFRKRVLTAYGNKCAVCDLDLDLLDAAHIVPVNAPGSTDETRNGLALCKNHHKALDDILISVAPDYRIEVSEKKSEHLRNRKIAQSLSEFKSGLRPIIRLPADRRDYPDPTYLRGGQKIRGWNP
ncbi:MAG: HNH endonuclease [Alphaproteobacteria bacterium]|nr:HNH endonuclease [Alphaproteobacteria bacterium]